MMPNVKCLLLELGQKQLDKCQMHDSDTCFIDYCLALIFFYPAVSECLCLANRSVDLLYDSLCSISTFC